MSNARFSSPSPQRSRHTSRCEDLLVVQDEDAPHIVRGLSIKLSRPVEESEESIDEDDQAQLATDTPTFYHSASNTSSLGSYENTSRISSSHLDSDLSQTNRLAELAEVTKDLTGALLPLNRTESRLPSIEDMLNDDTLVTSIYDAPRGPIWDMVSAAIREKEELSKIRALQLLVKASQSQDLTHLTPKVMRAVIDVVATFVKQNITKIVDFWRTVKDQDDGSIDINERLMTAKPSFLLKPWSHVSLGIKILRNWCVNPSVQELLAEQKLEDVFVLRVRLLHAAVAQATDPTQQSIFKADKLSQCYADEVANNLPKAVLTYLSNLSSNQNKIRRHLWTIMWPECYWSLLMIAGDRCFDHFCLLLHNNLTPLITELIDETDDSSVDSDDLPNPDVDILANDLANMSNDEKSTTVLKSQDFVSLINALLTLVWRRHNRQTSGITHHKGRLASVQGRAIQAEAISEDWFALLMLRLLSLGKGKSLKLLVESVLHRPVFSRQHKETSEQLYSPEELLSYAGCPKSCIEFGKAATYLCSIAAAQDPPLPVDLAAMLLYYAGEYAATGDNDRITMLQEHRTSEGEETERAKREKKLNRRWNLIRRNFITVGSVVYITGLLKEGVFDLAHCPSLAPVGFAKVNQLGISAGRSGMRRLVRPAVLCLMRLVTAPELVKKWSGATLKPLWDIMEALCLDFLPFMHRAIRKAPQDDQKRVSQSAEYDLYSKLVECCSPRDCLLTVAAICDSFPEGKEWLNIEFAQAVLAYQTFQTIDPGCEQAAIFLMSMLTKQNPRNQELYKKAIKN